MYRIRLALELARHRCELRWLRRHRQANQLIVRLRAAIGRLGDEFRE